MLWQLQKRDLFFAVRLILLISQSKVAPIFLQYFHLQMASNLLINANTVFKLYKTWPFLEWVYYYTLCSSVKSFTPHSLLCDHDIGVDFLWSRCTCRCPLMKFWRQLLKKKEHNMWWSINATDLNHYYALWISHVQNWEELQVKLEFSI